MDSTAGKIVRWIVLWLFKVLSRLEVAGQENIPQDGAVILAMNHLSRVDSPLVAVTLARTDATALVGHSYKKILPIRWLVNLWGGTWINRDQTDMGALRVALGILHDGGLLGLAPEGTRSRTGGLIPAKTGVAYLADKSGALILPVAVHGTERMFSELRRFRRAKVHLEYGPPFSLPPVERKERDAGLRRNTDEIMCRIGAMLPEQYWGVYADHPRLHELFEHAEIPAHNPHSTI
jgi:1-acyl-sn-glycerol-3-phosphate acyltransferase